MVAAGTVIDSILKFLKDAMLKKIEWDKEDGMGGCVFQKPDVQAAPKSYKIVCAGFGKAVVVQVPPPGDKKLLSMECFKK